MRYRGRNSVEVGLLDPDVSVYNSSRYSKCSCCITLLKVMCVLLLVVLIVGCYYIYSYISKESMIERDPVTSGIIIRKNMELLNYTSGTIKLNKYTDWQDFESRTSRCIKVMDISRDNNKVLITHIKFIEGVPSFRYRIDVKDLLSAQTIHIRDIETYQDGKGNFTSPMIYMSSNSDYPCMCTLLVSGNSRELFRKSDIVHMFNPTIHDSNTKANYARAKISLPFIRSLTEPFWMDLPPSITVGYEEIVNGIFVRTSVRLSDPIDIVNMINCVALNSAEQSLFWKLNQMK